MSSDVLFAARDGRLRDVEEHVLSRHRHLLRHEHVQVNGEQIVGSVL